MAKISSKENRCWKRRSPYWITSKITAAKNKLLYILTFKFWKQNYRLTTTKSWKFSKMSSIWFNRLDTSKIMILVKIRKISNMKIRVLCQNGYITGAKYRNKSLRPIGKLEITPWRSFFWKNTVKECNFLKSGKVCNMQNIYIKSPNCCKNWATTSFPRKTPWNANRA